MRGVNPTSAVVRSISAKLPVGGERDPARLAEHRDRRCRKSADEIARYLTGTWRDEHLFNLASALRLFDALETEVASYDARLLRSGWGQTILDRVKTLTDKPVTTIINTHTHADHVGNNPYFPATVEIVTHENTKTNMEKLPLFKDDGAKGLPDKTFKDKLSLFSGKDRIDLYYFGRGHTDGDIFVVFPSVRAVHAGDMFAFKSAMVVNLGNGGSAVELPQTLAKAVAGIKGVDTIITGHGLAVLPWRALDEQQRFNRDMVAWTQEADAFVVFPVVRAVHTGDMFAWRDVPTIDRAAAETAWSFPGRCRRRWQVSRT
jgi:glyoxylase-like metal-dependent hydrolase (beta-lactamase superfamily II)